MQSARRIFFALLLAAALAGLAGCATAPIIPRPAGWTETGGASWYGEAFQGRQTASGEPFDQRKLTAAHRTLPFGTYVEVTRLDNGKRVVVRINDRGPFVGGRIIDLSRAAAERLEMIRDGTAKVRLRVLEKPGGPPSI